jgi:hypothetical protein
MYSNLILSYFALFFGFNSEVVKDEGVSEKYHPLYVSVTEIEQNAADKALEISYKFFTDDFEHTLEKSNKKKLDIKSSKEKGEFDKYIPEYINKHFTLTVDNKLVQLRYIGFEIEKESVYCYFEANEVSSIKKVNISNSLLHDFKKEQINIMHLSINGKKQSTKLHYPTSKASFTF